MEDRLYIIYHGPWQEDGGKWAHKYAVTSDRSKVESMDPNYRFTAPLPGVTSVGVFSIRGRIDEEQTIHYGKRSAEWVGRFEDEEVGRIRTALIDIQRDLIATHKTAKNDTWLATLDEAREVYRRSRGGQRNVVLARIVKYVTAR